MNDQDPMLAWVSLIHTASHLRAGLEDTFQSSLGISLAEQDLLRQISVNPEPLTLSELAGRLYFSKAGITKMMDRLEAQKLLRRVPCPNDRRSLRAELTPKGKTTFKKSLAVLHNYVETNFIDHLSGSQISGLNKTLRTLLQGNNVWDGQMAHLRGEDHGE